MRSIDFEYLNCNIVCSLNDTYILSIHAYVNPSMWFQSLAQFLEMFQIFSAFQLDYNNITQQFCFSLVIKTHS